MGRLAMAGAVAGAAEGWEKGINNRVKERQMQLDEDRQARLEQARIDATAARDKARWEHDAEQRRLDREQRAQEIEDLIAGRQKVAETGAEATTTAAGLRTGADDWKTLKVKKKGWDDAASMPIEEEVVYKYKEAEGILYDVNDNRVLDTNSMSSAEQELFQNPDTIDAYVEQFGKKPGWFESIYGEKYGQ